MTDKDEILRLRAENERLEKELTCLALALSISYLENYTVQEMAKELDISATEPSVDDWREAVRKSMAAWEEK